MPGANEYFAVCDNNADFSSPEKESGWTADTQYTFSGLEHGQTYHYRVKARKTPPTGTNFESVWSNVESSNQQAVPLTVAVPAAAGEDDGILANQGSVTISSAWGADLIVHLQSSDTSQATVPATVMIPAGQTVASFDVTVHDNTELDGSRATAITATATDCLADSVSLTVHDNETAVLTVSLPAGATEGDGVLNGAGVVSVSQAPAVDVAVQLSCTDTSELTVPAMVTILAGQMSATFDVTIINDTLLDGPQTATVTAHVPSWTDGSNALDVLDNDGWLDLQLPVDIWEGAGTVNGSVTIGGTLDADLVVALASSDSLTLEVPGTVTIPAGQTTATLVLTVPDDSLPDGTHTATVTAAATDLPDDSVLITIHDDELHHFAWDTIGSPQRAGVAFTATLEARNVDDETISPFTGTAALSGAATGGTVPATPATTGAFAAGAWSGSITVSAVDAGVVLTAGDGAGHTGPSDAFDVDYGPLHHFAWSTVDSPQFEGVPFGATVTAQDAMGYTVTSYDGSATLSGYKRSESSRRVVITECDLGSPDFLEVQNISGDTLNTSGWVVAASSNYTDINLVNATLWSLPASMPAGRVLYKTDSSTDNYWGSNLSWGDGNNGWAIILDASGDIVDFVAWGWTASQIAAMNPTINGHAVTIGSAWSGNGVTATGTGTIQRVGSSDSQNAADLTWVSPASKGTENAGLTVPVAITPASMTFTAGVAAVDVTVQQTATEISLWADDGAGQAWNSNTFDVETLPLSVDVPAAATEGDPLLTGTVTIPRALEADLVVSLESGDTGAATVPGSVTIVAGQTAAPFDITVFDDSDLDGSQSTTITATADWATTGSDTLVVHDDETAVLTVALPDSAEEDAGNLTDAGTLTVSQAPSVNVAVALTSNDTSEATVPATVTILAGQTSATFDVTVIDDTLLDGLQTATVTAHVQNWTDGSGALDVLDNNGWLENNGWLDLQLPVDAWEGVGTINGSVTIGGTLDADLVMPLTSSDSSVLEVPATVTIPAGQTTATFLLTVPDDSLTDGVQTATVTAAAFGLPDDSVPVTIHDDELHHFTWGTIGSPKTVGVAFSVIVVARNVDNEVIVPFTGTAGLSGAGSGGAVPVTPATTGAFGPFHSIAGGVWRGLVTVSALADGVVLTADDGAGHTGASSAFDVVVGPLDHFAWSTVSSPQYDDVPFSATLTAQDALGYTVTDYAGTATLNAYEETAPVTIGAGNGVTGLPLVSSYRQSRTQVIYLQSELDGAAILTGLALDVFSTPGQMLNNWTIRMQHTSLGSYPTASLDASGWTTVYQANQTISATGWVDFVFSTPFAYNGTSNLLIDFSHDNIKRSSDGRVRYSSPGGTRTAYAYTNSVYVNPLQWTGNTAPTVSGGFNVPNLRLTTAVPVAITPTSVNFAAGVATEEITVSQTAAALTLLADNGVGQVGKSNAFDVQTLPLSVNVPVTATEDDPPLSGTVTIPATLEADLAVSLTSSDTSEATIPGSVTILAGQTSATFDITVLDDSDLDGPQSTTIAATATDCLAGSDTLIVQDNETAELTVSLPANVTEGDGVLTDAGTVSVNQPPVADFLVQMNSTDTSEVTVPATATILAGQTSATFDVTVVDDTLLDGTQTATVTAHVDNWTDGSDTLEVLDNDGWLDLQLPVDVWEGEGTLSGSVTLGGTLDADLVVTLLSSDSVVLEVPDPVTIPAGKTTAAFVLTVPDDTLPDGTHTATVTAAALGLPDEIVQVTIHDDELHHFGWATISGPQTAGEAFTVWLEARNVDDEKIVPFTGTAGLSGSGTGGTVPVTPAVTGAFAGGVWRGSVTLSALAESFVLTADDEAGHTGASNAFDVPSGPLDHFVWSNVSSPQLDAFPFTATITARDTQGYTVAGYNGTATLNGRSGSRDPVTIGTGEGMSGYPLRTAFHDSRTQVIYLQSELGEAKTISGLGLEVGIVPGQTLDNWTIRMQHTSLSSYTTPSLGYGGWTTVYQANETTAATGWVDFEFSTPFVYDGASNLLIDFSHNGSSSTSSGYVRSGITGSMRTACAYSHSDHGDPLSWSGSTSPTVSGWTSVPNLRLATSLPVAMTPTSATFAAGVWTGDVTVLQPASFVSLRADNGAGQTGYTNTFDVEDLTLSIDVPAAATEGDPPLTGTVTISAALPQDLVVSLASGDASEATVPDSVTIVTGQTVATFDITILDDSDWDGSQSTTITASTNDAVAENDTLIVHDNETAVLTVSLPANATEGNGVLGGAGAVSVSQTPAADVVVQLSSTDTGEVAVPATVTILAGQTSATFDMTVVDDTLLDGLQTASVTAHVHNWTNGSDVMEVLDNDGWLDLQLPDDAWENAGTVNGSVTLGGSPATDLVVSLTSSDSLVLEVPATVTVRAGQRTATFGLSVPDDSLLNGMQSATLTAAAPGLTGDTVQVTIHDDELHHFVWGTIDGPQTAGVEFTPTLEARNVDDERIVPFTGTAALSGAGTGGTVPVTPATTGNFSGGVWNGTAMVSELATNTVLTADDGAGHTGASNTFDVVSGPLHHFTWSTVSSPQFKDVPISATVTAQDALGYTVTGYNGTATLSGGQGGHGPVTTGTGGGLSHYPLQTLYHDSRTQVIYLQSELGAAAMITSLALDVSGTSGQTLNNWTIRMKHTSLRYYTTASLDAGGWTTVYQANETISATGWADFVFSTPFFYNGTSNLLIDFCHNNSSSTSYGDVRSSLVTMRTAYAHSDSGHGDPLQWTGTSSPAVFRQDSVPNVRLNTGMPIAITPTTVTLAAGTWTGDVTVLQTATNVSLRVDDGAGKKADSNTFDVQTLPLSVDVPAGANEGDPLLTGTATIPAPLEADLAVSLASGDTSEATVPGSVTIAAGQTAATFDITIQDDSDWDGSQSTTITATATDCLAGSGILTVHDNETAVLTVSLPANATEGDGVLSGAGMVSVSRAPAVDVVVQLSCTDTSEVTVPATVTILAGQTSAAFDVTVVDDTLLDGPQTATVTAHVQNWTDGSVALDVLDNNGWLHLQLPVDVWEGAGTFSGSLRLGGTLDGDLVVTLTSSDSLVLEVSATVTIPAGQTTAMFVLTVPDDSLPDGMHTATVTASALGLPDDSEQATIRDDDLHHFWWGTIDNPQTAGVAFTGTLEARNVDDEKIVPFTGTAGLSGTGTGGAVPVTPDTTGAFAGGAWSGPVTVSALAAGVVLTAGDGAAHSGASNTFDVVSGPLHRFAWSTINSPQFEGVPFSATVTAQDAMGYTVTGYGGNVTLGGWAQGGGSSSRVVITECDPDTPDFVEIQNVSGDTIDTPGWVIAASSSFTDIDSVNSTLWNLPASMPADQVLYKTDRSTDNYWGSNLNWGAGYNGWVMILDAAGGIVDFVAWGWTSSEIVAMNPTINGHAVTIGSAWSGHGVTSTGTGTIQRVGSSDNEDAADLTWVSPASKGTENAGLTVPFIGTVPVPIAPTVTGSFANGVWTGDVAVLQVSSDMYLRANDDSGHAGNSNNFDVIVDTFAPTVVGVTASDALVTDADVGQDEFAVTVEFSERMSAAPEPTLTFLPAVDSTLTFAGGQWTDPTHYTATYHVADADLAVDDVQIDVTGGEDLMGHAQADFAPQNEFSIQTATLIVEELLPTASGFVARLSAELEAGALSLYDVESGELGLADALLVGNTVGAVRGSLVYDPVGPAVEFVRTAGPLEPDVYTVTLRSADDGVKNVSGELLDGDASGTAGDDYVGTFTLSDVLPVLSIPDFTRGPGQDVNLPATVNGIPLTLSDAAGAQTVNFVLRYDPLLLTVTDIVGLPETWTGGVQELSPGQMQVSLSSNQPAAPGELVLGIIQAQVPTNAAYNSSAVLSIDNLAINDSAIPAREDRAVQLVAYFGDATGNTTYSGLDAQRVARIAAGLDSGLAAYPVIDPVIVADVTGNGGLSGLDAQRIARKAAGLPVEVIPDLPQPLRLESPPASRGLATALSASQLAPVFEAAVSRTVAAAAGRAAELLREITVEIVDLPGDMLGEVIDRRVSIDINGAGQGWFIDSTPWDDVEFAPLDAANNDHASQSGSPSQGRVDLLIVILHELGHVLGGQHEDDGLMNDRLPIGMRRLPSKSLFDLEQVPFDELEEVGVSLGPTTADQDTIDKVFAQLER